MDRRNFLVKSCGACASISLGLILGSSLLESCASTGLGVLKTSAANGKVIIPMNDFVQQNVKLLRVSNYDYDIAVEKKADGTYSAMVLKCTHAFHPLTKAGNNYYCTLHGSKFSPDGQVLKGPASRPMEHLKTEVDGSNLIISI